MATCDVCLNLNSNLYPDSEETYPPVAELEVSSQQLRRGAERSCAYCLMILNGIKAIQELAPHSFRDSWEPSRPYAVILLPRNDLPLEVLVRFNLGDGIHYYPCHFGLEFYTLKDLDPSPAVIGSGRHVPKQISIAESLVLIQSWINECDTHHVCALNGLPKLPKRILDLQSDGGLDHIILAEPENISGLYTAFSHCWGKKPLFQTTKENIAQRKKGFNYSELPKSFQDAISITRHLGLRYIWIDSLCILQNDLADWERESANMSAIYENCYLNISATRSHDSTGGCFGERWVPGQRFITSSDMRAFYLGRRQVETCQLKLEIQGDILNVFVRPSLQRSHSDFFRYYPKGDSLQTAPLIHRGWAFQERVLSPRTIHFHSAELVWECRHSYNCECSGISMQPLDLGSDESYLKHIYSRIEDATSEELCSLWLQLISHYANLDLTYGSDRLPAVSGLANRFKQTLNSRYLAGLWEADIARGLLWTVYIRFKHETESQAEEGIYLPTWSWVAGQTKRGHITYSDVIDRDYTFEQDMKLRLMSYECNLGANPYGRASSSSISLDGTWIVAIIVKETRVQDGYDPIRDGILPEAALIFDCDIDDMILVSLSSISERIYLDYNIFHDGEEQMAEGEIVCCLHLGYKILIEEGQSMYADDDAGEILPYCTSELKCGRNSHTDGCKSHNLTEDASRSEASSIFLVSLSRGLLLRPMSGTMNLYSRIGVLNNFDTENWGHVDEDHLITIV